jgi:hypothetical protein
MGRVALATSLPVAPYARGAFAERRRDPRYRVCGPAHVVDELGVVRHVTLIDLSAGGAMLSRPPAEWHLGEPVVVAGYAMPWERRGRVVGMTAERLHVRFDAGEAGGVADL